MEVFTLVAQRLMQEFTSEVKLSGLIRRTSVSVIGDAVELIN